MDAAKALGRSKQTILHWVQSGRLRSVQVTSGKRKGLRIELEKEPIGLFADADQKETQYAAFSRSLMTNTFLSIDPRAAGSHLLPGFRPLAVSRACH